MSLFKFNRKYRDGFYLVKYMDGLYLLLTSRVQKRRHTSRDLTK